LTARARTLLPALLAVVLAGCGGAKAPPSHTVRIAATAVPHAEILAFIKPELAEEGVNLDIRVFNDYVQPNTEVEEKQLDVNYFETLPYLAEFNRAKGTHLVPIIGVHIEPMGAYSRKFKSLDALPVGAQVAIPNEASNEGRALLLLQKTGLIQLKDPKNALSTLKDIVANPKGLKFHELEAATLPRTLGEVDLALINTNYALDAKLNPVRDALAIEDAKSPYVNYLVGRSDNQNDPDVKKLAAALTSPAVRAFIVGHYHGAVVPAF
jgi:D-methionine transport system substrate-binding protein